MDHLRPVTLSVVIPVYNGEPYIGKAIDSVLAQDFEDFELIIGDHSSTDNTLEIAKKYLSDSRVRIISTETGGYIGRSWNNVTSYASGTYIKLLCADDVLLDGTLERQVLLLESNPTAALVACPRNVTDALGRVILPDFGLGKLRRQMSGAEAIRVLVRSGRNLLGEPGCVMMRRDVLADSGGWFGEFPYVIDLATYCRVLTSGDFIPDKTTGAIFRLNSGQVSVSESKSQSEQVSKFLSWFDNSYPGTLRKTDLFIGRAKSNLSAKMRNFIFLVLKRRMKKS